MRRTRALAPPAAHRVGEIQRLDQRAPSDALAAISRSLFLTRRRRNATPAASNVAVAAPMPVDAPMIRRASPRAAAD
jgi:hypothetical protein